MKVKMWKNGLPHIAGGNVVHLLWKNLKVSLKIKHITTLGLSKSLPGIYPREMKTYVHINTYT